MKTKKAFPVLLSFLAIVSIASIAVLGNTQTAYAGLIFSCSIEPDMVDAGILAVGERFVAMKEIICLIEIVEVNIDDKSDCVDKGIEVRIGDFGIEPDELIWSGEEVIDNIAADIGKTTCTVIFDIDTLEGDQKLPQTIMVTTPEPEPVVGGEFLPIDSTALVLAGLQTSAIWMLPVLAGVAGSAFGVLYIKSRRN